MIVGSGRVDQETVHVGRLPGRPPPAELIWVENAAYIDYVKVINDHRAFKIILDDRGFFQGSINSACVYLKF